MNDLHTARIAAYRSNISRYRRLLRTHLTDLEQQFIEQRLLEDRMALRKLVAKRPEQRVPPEIATLTRTKSPPHAREY